MTDDLSTVLTDFEMRLARLEQRAPTTNLPSVQVTLNPAGTPVKTDPLDYSVGAWGSYPVLTPSVDANGVPGGTWNDSVPGEGYLPPQAYRVGNAIFLSGLVKRVTGSLAANAFLNSKMFLLPKGWRPARAVTLICPCATTLAPTAATAAGVALLLVTPNLGQSAGLVTVITATVSITAGSGWIGLCGAFPGMFTADAPIEIAGSWDQVPPSQTWDQINDSITWNSFS